MIPAAAVAISRYASTSRRALLEYLDGSRAGRSRRLADAKKEALSDRTLRPPAYLEVI